MSDILLLLENRNNRQLLVKALSPHHRVILPETDARLDGPFDLGIVDGISLDRSRDHILARKQSEQPTFLPFLLLTARRDVGMATRHLWKSVDEIIISPIEKTELQARVESLSRQRRLSLETTAARYRAEAADHVKSAFLATMSHELRTPLNSIIGFTGVLLQGLAGPLAPEQGKQLGIVRAASRHLLALINDVLDISKVEAGELHLEAGPFELRPLLDRLAAAFSQEAARRGLAFTHDPCPEGAMAVGDARRVEQVLNNLLSNAFKFTDKGAVHLSCRREGDGIAIEVSDTGIGIKAEDLDRLFLPFSRIDSDSTSLREGTGLGLAISDRLARAMGGSITVESTWRQGSRFRFTIPAGDPP